MSNFLPTRERLANVTKNKLLCSNRASNTSVQSHHRKQVMGDKTATTVPLDEVGSAFQYVR